MNSILPNTGPWGFATITLVLVPRKNYLNFTSLSQLYVTQREALIRATKKQTQ